MRRFSIGHRGRCERHSTPLISYVLSTAVMEFPMATEGDVDGNPPQAPVRFFHTTFADKAYDVEGVQVTCIHANHCPGAAATTFQSPTMLAVCGGDRRRAHASPAPRAFAARTHPHPPPRFLHWGYDLLARASSPCMLGTSRQGPCS